jgi:LCP family protein required for cell wall assembly
VQRLLFVCALTLAGAASAYSGLVLLGRIYPALFPGQTLGDALRISSVVPPLPGFESVTTLDPNSQLNDRINLLIIGLDRRPWEPELSPSRTDVVMVATIDPIGKRVSLLSFPRDMLIDLHLGPKKTDVRQDRINASYVQGFTAGNSFDSGARQLEKDLKENFGIEIDSWVLLDFTGVEKLVDAVGGIDVDVPRELSVGNWFYSDDDRNAVWLSFPPGVQHLDGYKAVAFGRHREYDSDFVRVKRQQLVLQAAVQKLFALGWLNNPVDLWDAYSSTVKTDLSRARMLGLVPLLKQTQGRMSTLSVADPVDGRVSVWDAPPEYGAVLFWDPENVQYWLSQAFPKVAYASANVEIQNGFGDEGAVRTNALARYLAYSRGVPTVYTGPDVPAQAQTSIVLYGDRRPLAEDIAKWLGMPASAIHNEPRPQGSMLPDVVIVIGRDFRIPG